MNEPFTNNTAMPLLDAGGRLADAARRVCELMPWDLRDRLAAEPSLLVLDVREPAELAAVLIAGSINVPRGILEASCDWDYEETLPLVAGGRERGIVVCRSGNRSLLVDDAGRAVDAESAEGLLVSRVRADQRRPR